MRSHELVTFEPHRVSPDNPHLGVTRAAGSSAGQSPPPRARQGHMPEAGDNLARPNRRHFRAVSYPGTRTRPSTTGAYSPEPTSGGAEDLPGARSCGSNGCTLAISESSGGGHAERRIEWARPWLPAARRPLWDARGARPERGGRRRPGRPRARGAPRVGRHPPPAGTGRPGVSDVR